MTGTTNLTALVTAAGKAHSAVVGAIVGGAQEKTRPRLSLWQRCWRNYATPVKLPQGTSNQ